MTERLNQNLRVYVNAKVVQLRFLWPILTASHMAFIYWSSSRTWEGGATELPMGVTNFVHFGLYGFLAGLAYLAMAGFGIVGTICDKRIAMAVTIFGFFDECHQYTVPGRDFSLFDVMTDGAGAWFAVKSLELLLRRPQPRNSKYLLGFLLLGIGSSFIFPRILPNF